MSWTTPRTWVAGEVETAAFMNAQLRDNLTLLATAIDTSNGKFQAVTSTYVKSLAGIVQVQNVNTTQVNNTGTGETDLITYTLPGGTLANNGQGVRVTAWGTTTNSANAKRVNMYFGTNSHGFASNLATSQTNHWGWLMVVIRTGATAQTRWDSFYSGPSGAADLTGQADGGNPGMTLSSNQVIKSTGTGGASNEINCQGQVVEIIQQ